MANIKEIKNRIKGVQDTQKITSAMYLIAATKMQKAKRELEGTKPYFYALQREIRNIFRQAGDLDSPYLLPAGQDEDENIDGTYGMLVITSDKGLAGAYNQNVIKEAHRLIGIHSDVRLYVVGEYGRHYFETQKIPVAHSFMYTAQNPTLKRAREISGILLNDFEKQRLTRIIVVYTDFSNGLMGGQVMSSNLLPLSRSRFGGEGTHHGENNVFEFEPSAEKVINNIIPSCITGLVYGAMVDSFCSEQCARMTAMDAANQNAKELLDNLKLQYNYIRQGAITQEITEISSGAKALKKKRKS
ncbi:MAG: ATP synthase F1 subunit gamma [Firmicutes bacterium]|nr:ATP synthase F1 subunit gamma [Bacillota bacterium]